MIKLEEFKSKKNQVILVKSDGGLFIEKSFSNKDAFCRELMVYEHLKGSGLNHPQLLDSDKNMLKTYIEYLEGQLLLDYLNKCEKNSEYQSAVKILSLTTKWIKQLHNEAFLKSKAYVQEDINFRNFIVIKDKVFGFDFESVNTSKEYNVEGRVLASYLLYSPSYTRFKKIVCNSFLLQYDKIKSNNISLQVKVEESLIKDRRTKFRCIK